MVAALAGLSLMSILLVEVLIILIETAVSNLIRAIRAGAQRIRGMPQLAGLHPAVSEGDGFLKRIQGVSRNKGPLTRGQQKEGSAPILCNFDISA